MQLMDSHIEAGQDLSAKDKQAYYTALVEYLYYGKEPDLKGPAKAVFVAIKPTLDNSRARAEAGSKGGSNRQANHEANAKQTAKQNESKSESNAEAKSKSKGNIEETSPNGEEKKSARMARPTVQEVADYAAERGDPSFNAERFVDYYESNGWKVGRNPMRDWKATVRTWMAKDGRKEQSDAAAFAAYGSVFD